MEVPWVSFLIILCSRSTAVHINRSNSSTIDDFYLLDKDMQLEICNMIKDTNTSVQFTQQERMQVKQDFCDQLEHLDNQEIGRNILLVDDRRSSGSNFSDQVFSVRSTSFSEMGDGFTVSGPAPELIPDRESIGSLSPAFEENPQSTTSKVISTSLAPEHSKSSETFRSLITSKDSDSSWDTTTLSSSSSSPSSGTSTSEAAASMMSEDSITITTDLSDQSSTKLSGNFNQRVIILNSNTPMIPDPTYSDEEMTLLNSQELINLDRYSSKSTLVANQSSKNDQLINVSQDEKYSCSCNENKNGEENLLDKYSKSSPSLKHKKCSKCLKKSSNTSHEIDQNYDLETAQETKVLDSQKFPKDESSEFKSSTVESCFQCSTGGFPQSTKNSIEKYYSSPPESRKSSSRDFSTGFSNISLSRSSQLTPFEKSTSESTILDQYTSKSTSATYTTQKSDPCLECWLSKVSSITSEDPSYNSSCLKYCSLESSTYFINLSSNIITNPSSSSSSSYDLEASYDTLSSPSNSSNSDTESTLRLSYESSTFLPNHTLITSNSTPYFCGSSAKPRSYFNTTTSTASLPKPLCNPNKLTVNSKSPRKSRRLTKILSSLGKLHSYAGFFKVDQQHDTRLFFWFFCNQKWKHTPLIVWLQGEPGLSSLHGLFLEHGPYYLEHEEDGFDMKLRKFSWTKEYSVLYLDHCVGCGFSSSENHRAYIPSYGQVARDVYQALSQFFKVWYEMLPNDLYLAGSYGGAKYIPVIAQTIHDENKLGICSQKMNLKGLMIGGPYMDSGVMVNYNDFFLANGIIDEFSHKDMIPMQCHAQELIKAGKYQDAIDFLNLHVYCLMSQAGYEVYEDVRYLKETPEENMQNVVQSEQFKKMICIDDINFEIKSDVLIEEIMPSVNTLVSELLRHYKVLYYNGQFDLMAPSMLTSKALLKLEWESIDQFYTTEITNWCPQEDSNLCPEGYFRNYQNLTHVVIRNSGHFVGTTNSRSLYYLLKWFVEDKFQAYHDRDNWYK